MCQGSDETSTVLTVSDDELGWTYLKGLRYVPVLPNFPTE